jgi:pyruvate dehydrogenase E2 component (dihydrolipoamide acetyltransferase)
VAAEVVMPALGMAQETGTLLRWLKAPGDEVAEGEPLMEIETDKATVEIEAPASGVLADVRAGVGDEVPVGRVVALILRAGEEPPPAAEAEAGPTPTPEPAPEPAGTAGPAGAEAPARVLASPLARRAARERGVDLAAVTGTGPDGAVLLADVPAPDRARQEPGLTELGALWRRMAERVTRSWTTTPHFHLLREARADRLEGRLAAAGDQAGRQLTYTDLLVRLTATALRRHPELNSSWRDGRVLRCPDVHVGLAVAVEDGLVVPVIRDADRLDLAGIAARRVDLVERARERRLDPADLSGGTFTISNLGMYGVDAFLAVINPPQAAILTVGRVAPRVVAEGDRPVVRPTVGLGLACDHRVVDGARAASFLQTLVGLVERADPEDFTADGGARVGSGAEEEEPWLEVDGS